jgi:site-specific DNA recombinase
MTARASAIGPPKAGRAYAYSRGLGTEAYRFGGARVCRNTQVRTDLGALAVWREVRALLEHPDRLMEEYRRRLPPHAHARRHARTSVEGQLGRLRQGLARLIDSYAEGLMEKREFEPRITHLRQRVTKREEQAHQRADDAAWHTELQLIIGRLEACAAQVTDGLEEADWTSRRELIRALVKRVEVDDDQVHVVFRVDQRPGEPSPEKNRLQLCRGSNDSSLRCPAQGGVVGPFFAVSRL